MVAVLIYYFIFVMYAISFSLAIFKFFDIFLDWIKTFIK